MNRARVGVLAGASAGAVAVVFALLGAGSERGPVRDAVAPGLAPGRAVAPAALRAETARPGAPAIAGPGGPVAVARATYDHDDPSHEHAHDCQGRGGRPCGVGTTATFDALVARLLAAVTAHDEGARARVREELHSFIDADLARAQDLALGALAAAGSGPEADELAALLLDAVEERPRGALLARLDALAHDGRAHVRTAALRALGELPCPDDERVTLVAGGVRDGEEPVRLAAAAALGRIERDDATLRVRVAREAAAALPGERSAYVRMALAHAIRDAGSQAALIDALATDSEPAVRRSCADALAEIARGESGATARKALVARYPNEPDEDVRAAIARGLCEENR